ncbi:MAG: flagellar assembly protein FliW [Melioribacteraceae bacterium]|nr:flagellar assembly protein FliW [Melioribacteraceae bacterium]
MKIRTQQFGEIEFEEEKIIEFKDGVLGFENLTKFLLLTEENSIFFWLTSIEEPEIVFPLFPVSILMEEYPEKENFEAFGIVRLDKEIKNITINLKGPVYISQEQKRGYQKIIDSDKYVIDYQLFVEN